MGLWNHTDTKTKIKFVLVNKHVNSLRATVRLKSVERAEFISNSTAPQGFFNT